jgi:CRP-like cAMP-binding protein
MSLLTGEPRTATVSAVEDAVLIEVDSETVRGLVLANPSVVEAMSLVVVARRAGLDAARAAALEDAGLRAQSTSLVSRIKQFLRL